MSTLTRSDKWQTNTEIAHLHFKAVVAVVAVVVHFLPHLQFQASDVNKFFVRVVDDRDRVGEDEGGREEGGRRGGDCNGGGSFVR